MEKYIGTYHKSSLLYKICWRNKSVVLKSCGIITPQYADFLKSGTGQLPTCLQNPPQFADFLKSAAGQLPKLPTCLQKSPLVCRFPKSATGQLPKLPTCACRNPPSMQIFSNLPLDSCLHVLAEIPPIADFPKSATLQIYWNLHAEIHPPNMCERHCG